MDPSPSPEYADFRCPGSTILSYVEPKPIRWFSRGRLATGKLTILEGSPGLGKSTLVCEWAARVSRGEALPGGEPAPPGDVLLLAADDNLADVIRPRLEAAGADLSHVSAIVCDPDRRPDVPAPVIPTDMPFIAQIVRFVEAALIIVDPFTALLNRPFHPGRDHDVRRILTPLATLAARSGAAVLLTCHPLKSSIHAAHFGLLLASDPDDPSLCILASTHCNLSAPPPALAFRLESVPGTDVARIALLGASPRTAAELAYPPTPTQPTERAAAKAWLTTTLADGPLAVREVEELAKHAGIASLTLRRARENIGVISKRAGLGAGSSYLWSLPRAQKAESHQVVHVDNLDNLDNQSLES